MKEIRWLHFSDLHIGCSKYEWLWPSIKTCFYEDLKKQHSSSGPWDLVIFTGDLTFSGTEFKELDSVFTEIWECFRTLGSNPSLVFVPGNHDLVRPEPFNAIAKALGNWNKDADLRKFFWSTSENEYRHYIDAEFANFRNWSVTTEIPLVKAKLGILPGDLAASLELNGCSLGIVGLNTSFLQFNDNIDIGQLSIHVMQFNNLLDSDSYNWLNKHDFNILLTHHSIEWFDNESKEMFLSSIFPPNSFSAHFCGHMHESTSTHTSESGSSPRLTLKAPSLFGPDKWANFHDRIHGYSAGKFYINGESKGIRQWPRRLVKKNAGHYKIEVDNGYDTNNECVDYKLKSPLNVEVLPKNLQQIDILKNEISQYTESKKNINLMQFPIYAEKYHQVVRISEQAKFYESMNTSRCAWITADWGTGKDGFLRSVLNNLPCISQNDESKCLRFTCDEIDNIEQLLSLIEDTASVPLQELCHQFANNTLCMIFDNIPQSLTCNENINGIENIFHTILDYSPVFYIVAISRLKVVSHNFATIELKSLDAPEVRAYTLNHPQNIYNDIDGHLVDKICSMSQGLPLYIDLILKTIAISSIDEIYELDIDLSLENLESQEKVPAALKCAISVIKNAKDDYTRRSFELLKVLSVLANGETFKKIKRFNNAKPFYAQNVSMLVDLSLLETIPIRTQTTDISPKQIPIDDLEVNNLLRAPRQVRDYVKSLLTEIDIVEINKTAADLLFGSEWKLGKIRMSGTNFFKSKGVKPIEIGNEHIISKSLIVHAIKANDNLLLNQAAHLGSSFCRLLVGEHRFKDGMMATEELAHFLAQGNKSSELAAIKLLHAKCLRMLGKTNAALAVFDELLEVHVTDLDKDDKASIYLNIALIKQHNEPKEAIDAALQAQKLTKKNDSIYNQSESVIMECTYEGTEKKSRLTELEAKARNKKHYVVANNICLDLAKEDQTDNKLKLYDRIINSSDDDHYNKIRAIIGRISILATPDNIKMISSKDCYNISIAYTYLFSQRFSDLFNRCHDAIWRLLQYDGQYDKMLRLFLHSSFLWRIMGNTDNEIKYINDLSGVDFDSNILQRNEYRYFKSRSNYLL